MTTYSDEDYWPLYSWDGASTHSIRESTESAHYHMYHKAVQRIYQNNRAAAGSFIPVHHGGHRPATLKPVWIVWIRSHLAHAAWSTRYEGSARGNWLGARLEPGPRVSGSRLRWDAQIGAERDYQHQLVWELSVNPSRSSIRQILYQEHNPRNISWGNKVMGHHFPWKGLWMMEKHLKMPAGKVCVQRAVSSIGHTRGSSLVLYNIVHKHHFDYSILYVEWNHRFTPVKTEHIPVY